MLDESRPYTPTDGLFGIHMAVTPATATTTIRLTRCGSGSPPLYCTTEDLLSQSFTYPFLIPMLENAGAIVHTSRERDRQSSSVTVKMGHDRFRTDGRWEESVGGGYVPDSARICSDSLQTVTYNAATGNGPARNVNGHVDPPYPEGGRLRRLRDLPIGLDTLTMPAT